MTTELELERRMISEGADRFWDAVERTKVKHVTTRQGAGSALLQRAVNALAPEIARWVKTAKHRPGPDNALLKYLKKIPPPLVAFIAARSVLDGLVEKRDLPNLAGRMGARLMDEVRLRHLKKMEPLAWERSWRRLSKLSSYRNKRHGFELEAEKRGHLLPPWPAKDRMRMGAFLIEMVRTYTGLIEIRNVRDTTSRKMRHRSLVLPTDEALTWMESVNERLAAASPRHYPMIEPPLPWRGVYGGGYHSAELQSPAVLTGRTQLDQLEAAVEAGPEEHGTFLKAMNGAQDVRWRVNKTVLGVFQALWTAGGGVAGLPDRAAVELPPYPPDHDMEARMAWRRVARGVHLKRVEEGSRRMNTARVLAVAEELGDRLYYPHSADFRGRLYPVNSALFPQGTDLSRGLLEFGNPSPPGEFGNGGSMWWLKVHLANTFGVDKVPFTERVAWAESHQKEILRAGMSPLEHRWWTTAADPWQFLAAAVEYVRVVDEGWGEGSRLPVQIDGSNNGLQIYAMLARDPASAEATNCTMSGRPQDIYQRVADRVMADLKGRGTPEALAAIELVGERWGRKSVKRSVMVLPYGGTQHSVFQHVRTWFDEEMRAMWAPGVSKTLAFLSGVLWENMAEEMPGALAVMAWLRSVALEFAQKGAPLWWVSPSGFLVRQEYPKRSSGRIKTVMGEIVRYTRYRDSVPDTIDARRQANGFPPNYVHSLDAAILHEVTVRAMAAGITNIRLVHDAFATTPDRMNELAAIVREVFASTFENDPLNELYEQLVAQAPEGVTVPQPPARGSLNVGLARESLYLFS